MREVGAKECCDSPFLCRTAEIRYSAVSCDLARFFPMKAHLCHLAPQKIISHQSILLLQLARPTSDFRSSSDYRASREPWDQASPFSRKSINSMDPMKLLKTLACLRDLGIQYGMVNYHIWIPTGISLWKIATKSMDWISHCCNE